MGVIEFVKTSTARRRIRKAFVAQELEQKTLTYKRRRSGEVDAVYDGLSYTFSAASMERAEAEVSRGAALLDAHAPGWEEVLQLDLLSLPDCEVCVCGQLAYATKQAGEEGREVWALMSQLNADSAYGAFRRAVLGIGGAKSPTYYGFAGGLRTEIAWHDLVTKRRKKTAARLRRRAAA